MPDSIHTPPDSRKEPRREARRKRLPRRSEIVTDTRCALRLFGCESWATTKDHIIPRSRGGSDNPANLRPACNRCNQRKADRLDSELTEWDFPFGDPRRDAHRRSPQGSSGRHRAPRPIPYFTCRCCGVRFVIDADQLRGLMPTVFAWSELLGRPPSLDWLPTQILDLAERVVEQHDTVCASPDPDGEGE